MRSHWTTRIGKLTVLIAILWWQCRYTETVHNPMYGWPMPFNNLWYRGFDEWNLLILTIDLAVWMVLAASLGVVVERWQRKPNRRKLTISGVIAFQAVLAGLLALAIGEAWLRAHPNNNSVFPVYAQRQFGNLNVWFDIGLFTDPPHRWPLVRIIIVTAMGCAIYLGGSILWGTLQRLVEIVWRWKSRQTPAPQHGSSNGVIRAIKTPAEDTPSGPNVEPALARVAAWGLIVAIGYLMLTTLLPPSIL